MNIFTVSFFGHRIINNPCLIQAQLEKVIRDLLISKDYVEFLVGRSGEFDLLVSSMVRKAQREVRDDNSALVLVLPYMTAELRDNERNFSEYYDEIEICHESSIVHFKGAHQIRNWTLVCRSDLSVFFVERKSGGAYQTMRYAEREKKKYINLATPNQPED